MPGFQIKYVVQDTAMFSATHNRLSLRVQEKEAHAGNFSTLDTMIPSTQAPNFCPGQLVMVTFEQILR